MTCKTNINGVQKWRKGGYIRIYIYIIYKLTSWLWIFSFRIFMYILFF